MPFNNWAEVEAVAQAMNSELPIIVAGTGLRSEEWLALEWRDVDLVNGLLHVRRVYVNSRVKDYGKTQGSIRTIPLSARVVEAFNRMPRGIGGGLVFPGSRGKHMSLSHWRRNVWYSALEKAELEKRVPYAMRDTFAPFPLEAGVPTLHLARIMGTSLEMIDRTYGQCSKTQRIGFVVYSMPTTRTRRETGRDWTLAAKSIVNETLESPANAGLFAMWAGIAS